MFVKFATYNIQYGVGQDGHYDLSRIVEMVDGQDIICLQEVSTNWQVCNRDDQPGILSARLNRYASYATGYEVDDSRCNTDGMIVNSRRCFGNMILSRWPIIYARPHSLPRPKIDVPPEFHPCVDLPRTALEAVIDIDGKPVRVFSLHLSHLPGAQRDAQIDVLKNLTASLPHESELWEDKLSLKLYSESRPAPRVPTSTLLFGDFNFEPDSADYTRMTSLVEGQDFSLVDGWACSDELRSEAGTSVESDGRVSRLDYMFVTPDLSNNIRSARVDQMSKASDHFPIYFEVEISGC